MTGAKTRITLKGGTWINVEDSLADVFAVMAQPEKHEAAVWFGVVHERLGRSGKYEPVVRRTAIRVAAIVMAEEAPS